MKIITYKLLIVLLLFSACSSNNDGSTNNTTVSSASDDAANTTATTATTSNETAAPATASQGMQTGENGLKYAIHTNNDGSKAKFGDFLTLNMQYATVKDSVIFTSFGKGKPLTFKFQKTLFKGLLNDGIQKMSANDSATFMIVADSLYADGLPKFLKPGDNIKYTIAIQKIQSETDYQSEQQDIRTKQLVEDNKAIDGYLQKNKIDGLKIQTSGLRHTIEKEGEGSNISPRDIVKAKYTLTALTGDQAKEIDKFDTPTELKIHTRGLREAVTMLKKGGKGTFILPSVIAFGDRKRGKIPANANLLYDMEIVEVTPRTPSPK